MIDLSTNYMGLRLSSPVIVGSSGLTNKPENIKQFEKLGAGAVVLKSLFEEQIRLEMFSQLRDNTANVMYPEAFDYISNYSREQQVNKYLEIIKATSSQTTIPIIASINCTSAEDWISYARQFESAGAHALELNIFVLPSDPGIEGIKNESIYFEIIEKVIPSVNIPVSIKISNYFSSFAKTAVELSKTGIKGLVLFNRFYSPDIDIDKMEVVSSNVFSAPEEISLSLRWVAMLSSRIKCDLCASTGVHDGSALIKQMLAGAKAVQLVSTLYKNGFERIVTVNSQLKNWMLSKGFNTTDEFIGKLSLKNVENPAAFERVQFMKYFAGIE